MRKVRTGPDGKILPYQYRPGKTREEKNRKYIERIELLAEDRAKKATTRQNIKAKHQETEQENINLKKQNLAMQNEMELLRQQVATYQAASNSSSFDQDQEEQFRSNLNTLQDLDKEPEKNGQTSRQSSPAPEKEREELMTTTDDELENPCPVVTLPKKAKSKGTSVGAKSTRPKPTRPKATHPKSTRPKSTRQASKGKGNK